MDRTRPTPRRWLRRAEIFVAVASASFVVAAISLLRLSELPAGLLLVAALGAGAAPFVFLVSAGVGRGPATRQLEAPPGPGPGSAATLTSVTTVVRVGGEPLELIRAGLILAARAGPTVVVTATRQDLPELLAPLVLPVYVGSTVEEALNDAVAEISTRAVLVIEPGVLPIATACEAAAARLRGRIGWSVGTARSFDAESYAPECRETLGTRLRAAARARGLVLWERDATLVRTDLLRLHPLEPARPWGAWLRAQATRGFHGCEVAALTMRSAPTGAPAFWPAAVGNERERAADLGDAVVGGAFRMRVLALALLTRELYAYPLGIWLLAPLVVALTGAFPFRFASGLFLTLLGGLAVARWLVLRLSYDVELQPLNELVAASYDAPGSLCALHAAITGRVNPTRMRASPRVLMWAALAFVVASLVPLLNREGTSGTDVAAGLALVELALLWLFLLRVFAQRHWMRSVARARLELHAVVDGIPASTVDVSPSGVAVAVDSGSHPVGTMASISLSFPDGPPLATTAVVTDRRVAAGEEIVGLSLQLDPEQSVRWVRQAFDQLDLDDAGAARPAAGLVAVTDRRSWMRTDRAIEIADRVSIALVAAISVAVLCVLALALLGYRPVVVSSESMVPTLEVGDLIVVDDVRADELRVGDIVTFDDRDRSGEIVTHRVVRIDPDGELIRFETRGDANRESEAWSRPSDAVLSRLSLRVPEVGHALGWLRAPDLLWVFLGLGMALVLATIARATRVAHPHAG